MTQEHSTEREWLRWTEAQKRATETWISGDLPGAIGLINQYIESVPPLDLRRQAIAFRGDLHEEQGDLEAARADFCLAHDLSEKADYERYTLELALGSLATALADLETADHWYLNALETAAADLTTSGGTALLRLLELRSNRGLDEEERRLAEKVVRQAWHLLRVEGEPDFKDLEGTAKKLLAAQSQPFSAELPPSSEAF